MPGNVSQAGYGLQHNGCTPRLKFVCSLGEKIFVKGKVGYPVSSSRTLSPQDRATVLRSEALLVPSSIFPSSYVCHNSRPPTFESGSWIFPHPLLEPSLCSVRTNTPRHIFLDKFYAWKAKVLSFSWFFLLRYDVQSFENRYCFVDSCFIVSSFYIKKFF